MIVKSKVTVEEGDSDEHDNIIEDSDSEEHSDVNTNDLSNDDSSSDSIGNGNSEGNRTPADEELGEGENDINVNAGWADSITKILKTNKPKGKKTLVLSKAKKISSVSKKKPKDVGFEVEDKEGQIKREIETDSSDDDSELKHSVRKKRKELPRFRVKPDILQKDRERKLCKIATKGVVQLFNAVRSQQKDINEKLKEAGPLEVRRDKALKSIDKRTFLDVLMDKKSETVNESSVPETKLDTTKRKTREKPMWDVLKDDFMMGAKMKDWDKEVEEETEELEVEVESA